MTIWIILAVLFLMSIIGTYISIKNAEKGEWGGGSIPIETGAVGDFCQPTYGPDFSPIFLKHSHFLNSEDFDINLPSSPIKGEKIKIMHKDGAKAIEGNNAEKIIVDEMSKINPLIKAVNYTTGRRFEKQENIRQIVGYNTLLLDEKGYRNIPELELGCDIDEFKEALNKASNKASKVAQGLGITAEEIYEAVKLMSEGLDKVKEGGENE